MRRNIVFHCKSHVGIAGVVTTVGRVEGLSSEGDLRRGRMSESTWQVEGLFESLLSESCGGGT